MKLLKYVSLLVLISFLIVPIAACGSTPEPLTMDNLPIYAGAQASTDENYVNIITTSADAFKQSVPDVDKMESKTYVLPADTAWEAVDKYYEEQLTKDGWQTDPKFVANDPQVHVKAWIRGKQVLVVIFVSMDALPDKVLGVALASLK
jgi:hypothetical protein